MWTSKKARGPPPNEINSVSNRPLVFSNELNDVDLGSALATDPPARSQTDETLYNQLDEVSSPTIDDSTGLPSYQNDLDNDGRRPKAKRRRTGSSVRSAASSMWLKTRDTVSQFNVPRLAAPWEHELTEKDEINGSPSRTIRDFDYRRQRRRLFINSTFQWAITAAIALGLFAVLYSYSNFPFVDQNQKHVFNALVTFLSILLGLNLASSLSGYAQMMRWRLLAAKYRNLQDFELIMNCSSQMKVFRLLWAGRTRGRWWIPNRTQLLCFTWLTINVALQVFTALLGLTYSVDISTTYVQSAWGNVSIADLSSIRNNYYNGEVDFNIQGGAANSYGMEGQDYYLYLDVPAADQTNPDAIWSTSAMDSYWYRFIDRNPSDSTETLVSARTVTSTAHCEEFEVLSGGYDPSDEFVTYFDTNLAQNVTVWVPLTATGCATWISDRNQTCGSRCTTTMMLLFADQIQGSAPKPLFFSCNNTVGQVTNTGEYANSSAYLIPDISARAWAGGIGFSGITHNGTSLEYVLYEYASLWSPAGTTKVNGITQYTDSTSVSHLIMEFTAGAIAAVDTNGPRLNVSGWYPFQTQVVDVTWPYAIALLAGIPGFQFLVLLAVLVWANKVIIKDTSFLASARLLRPVVEKLGNKGCLLTGDEIAEELGNYRLKYGVRNPPQNSMAYSGLGGDFVRHVDVIEEDEGLGRADARMVNGLYDGTSTWVVNNDEPKPLPRRRGVRRMSI